ncbi:MAG: hypothetical protein K5640_00180 [Treponema sp.]|nr:hypothetical protein [Treponema sp.]
MVDFFFRQSFFATDYTCTNTEDKVSLLSVREVTTTDYGFGILGIVHVIVLEN